MATQGTVVQRSTLMGTNLVDTGVVNTSGVVSAANATRYHYVSCFAFNFLFKGWYQFLGSPHYEVQIHYWNGSDWVYAGGDSDVCNETIEWEINRNSGSYRYVSGPTYMWRLSVRHYSGVSGNTAREMRLWLHGPGETPTAYWDGNVKTREVACLSTGSLYSLGNTTSSPATSIGIFATVGQRANPLSAGIAHNRYVPRLL
jgi:hypothetical protein